MFCKVHRCFFSILIAGSVCVFFVFGCSGKSGNTGIVSSNSGTTLPDAANSGLTNTTIPTVDTTPSRTAADTTDTSTTTTGTIPGPTYTKLSWEAPAFYTDGITTLRPADISEYRIYIYTDPNLASSYSVIYYPVTGPTPATSVLLNDFNNSVFTTQASRTIKTTYYLSVKAVANNLESAPSNSVSYTYPP